MLYSKILLRKIANFAGPHLNPLLRIQSRSRNILVEPEPVPGSAPTAPALNLTFNL
jgi:hypothetical protein